MHIVEGKFFDVTVLGKLTNKYVLVQADSAEEAAGMCRQFGEVDNIRKVACQTLILKGEK